MNGDNHPVGSPSAESGRAKIDFAALRNKAAEDFVLPLDWSVEYQAETFTRWSAMTALGPYFATSEFAVPTSKGPRTQLSTWRGPMSNASENAVSVEAAMASAQADFAKRILSAINPALLERIEALEAAVAPFAAVGDIFEVRAGNRPNDDDDPITEWTDHRVGSRLITVGDFRRARKALSGEKKP